MILKWKKMKTQIVLIKWKKIMVKLHLLKELKENQLKRLSVKNLHLNKSLRREVKPQVKNENVKFLTNLKIKN